MSVAVIVFEPAVFSVTLNTFVPATSAAPAGTVAFASDDVIVTVSVMLVIKFQFASTALTVTLNPPPAVAAVGSPVFPVALPGAAASPGTSSCSFATAPVVTEMPGLTFAAVAGVVTSLAVIVREPAVFSVTLKLFVPATSAVFAGTEAFVSLDVIATMSMMIVLTIVQFASTALTVMLRNAVPAVRRRRPFRSCRLKCREQRSRRNRAVEVSRNGCPQTTLIPALIDALTVPASGIGRRDRPGTRRLQRPR